MLGGGASVSQRAGLHLAPKPVSAAGNQWRIRRIVLGERRGSKGCAPSGGAGDRAPAEGSGAKPHRSWSVNAFCVMVKSFS